MINVGMKELILLICSIVFGTLATLREYSYYQQYFRFPLQSILATIIVSATVIFTYIALTVLYFDILLIFTRKDYISLI